MFPFGAKKVLSIARGQYLFSKANSSSWRKLDETLSLWLSFAYAQKSTFNLEEAALVAGYSCDKR